eukprot:1690886-Pleurochrysis_carterae.AAC.1
MSSVSRARVDLAVSDLELGWAEMSKGSVADRGGRPRSARVRRTTKREAMARSGDRARSLISDEFGMAPDVSALRIAA